MENTSPQSGGQALRMIRDHIRNGTFRELLADWKWILGFTDGYRKAIVLYTIFGLAGSILGLAGSLLSKLLIDSIMSKSMATLVRLAPALVLSSAAGVLFHALYSRFSAKLGVSLQNHVQSTIFDRMIHSQWLGISRYSTGDLINRFSSDVNTVSSCAISLVPSFVIQPLTVLAVLGIILYYDPVMALIGCASTPVLFFISNHLIKKQREHNRIIRRVSSDLYVFQSETFRNIDTLKSFGIEDHVTGQLQECQDRYLNATMEYNRFSVQTHATMTVVNTVVQYLTLGYCLWQFWNGRMEITTMFLFLQLRSSLQNAFSALIGLIPKVLSGSVAAERLRELMEIPPEEESAPPDTVTGPCSITVDQVSLAYEADRTVLENVELQAGPGQTVALVGPSGQGKTTLLRMMLGLIHPVSGSAELTVDGGEPIPLSSATRRYFTYVPQGNTLLAGTVAENLRLVAPDASEEDIIRALKAACAWDFVEKLPNGIHSSLGEHGRGVSEGQAQRLAIARALMRKAPILLLDEVTSALDMATEEQVLHNLMELGLTCIVTTHRPSVLKMCTAVYRVEDHQVLPLSRDDLFHMTTTVQ